MICVYNSAQLTNNLELFLFDPDDHQLFPVCEPVPEEAAGGGELHEEEEQYKYEPSTSLNPLEELSVALFHYQYNS